ncbi:MAG TPA: tetratricopeptide repeat protein [Gemmatimonadaceae bacterium]|nr:tetratricopeptide repeat protein [Gemmatimonadaceae bacterium]
MSVIHDALKTAQREKQDRERGMSPAGMPLIAPMRGRSAEKPFDWKNAATIAVASIVIVGATYSLWVRMKNLTSRPAASAPAATVPIRAADSVPVTTPAVSAAVTRPAATVAALDEPGADPLPPRSVVRQPAPVRQSPVVRQAPRVVASNRVAPDSVAPATPLREPLQSGRLRIAVEQPRGGDAARLFAMGVAAHRAGDLAAARSAYERVLAIAPNDVDALNNMGVLLAASRELEGAESMLRRAVRLAPRHTGAWNNLGTVLAQRGQSADAISAFQQALALDPQHQGARVSLAQQYLAIGSGGNAREVLEEVLAINPSMPEAHYAMGQAYEMDKDWAGAIRAYGAFIRVAPPRLSADVERVQQRIEMLSARAR